ncbi:hypothetical protein V1477_018138 [Vespula maculifrons]|uniref:Uncharacterized protein n=1 Tax=Vespula maculifrons TaxID=7453 RepID=A0ABD2AZ01_VESMC
MDNVFMGIVGRTRCLRSRTDRRTNKEAKEEETYGMEISSIKYDTNGKTMLAWRWSILGTSVVPSDDVTSVAGDNYRTLINFQRVFTPLIRVVQARPSTPYGNPLRVLLFVRMVKKQRDGSSDEEREQGGRPKRSNAADVLGRWHEGEKKGERRMVTEEYGDVMGGSTRKRHFCGETRLEMGWKKK